MLERRHIQHNSNEWLAFRQVGIGGSDAAAILGKSPFKTNMEIWEEKVGKRKAEDISEKSQVIYGKSAEDLLVKMFEIDYPTYKVKIDKTTVYQRGFMFASLDAELQDTKTGELGFLEIKTNEVYSGLDLQKWDKKVPEYYYIQVLHYFIVTGFSFAVLKAQIKKTGTNGEIELITRHYKFYRKDLLEDLRYLYLKEREFWDSVVQKKRPSLILPSIEKIK